MSVLGRTEGPPTQLTCSVKQEEEEEATICRMDHVQSDSMSGTFAGSPTLLMLAADVCQHIGDIAVYLNGWLC